MKREFRNFFDNFKVFVISPGIVNYGGDLRITESHRLQSAVGLLSYIY